MIKSNYSPIITNTTKTIFVDYVDSLDIPQIDYFAIGIQNLELRKSISLMSQPEWQKMFVANCFADYDPIRSAALFTKRNFIPFAEIDCIDNFGKEIMRQRSKMGIKNGIVLMQRFPKHSYMITLGTGYSGFDSYEFIKRYHDKICYIKNDLISLIKKDALQFLPQEKRQIKNSIHLSIDAK